MKRWFLSLLLLANCAPFGEAPADSTTSDQAATTPSKKSATSAANSDGATSSATSNAPSTASSTTFTESALWPVVDNKVVIPLCYDSTIPNGMRGNITQMVRAQWNLLSPLSFTGFLACAEGDITSVRVMASPVGAQVTGLGQMTNAMVLLDTTDSNNFVANALHELGHVAGLGHEAYAANASAEQSVCADFISEMMSATGIAHDLPVDAPSDRNVLDPGGSIMSRCHLSSPGISDADNKAIAKIYGVPAIDWSSIEGEDNINQ